MTARSTLGAVVIGVAVVLLLPPIALADTCCANTSIGLDPSAAEPGDAVRLVGMQCLKADNTGPNPLSLGSFWLWKGDRDAEANPDEAPGPGLPADLPPIEDWLPFDSVTEGAGNTGSAVITVPDLADGTYQLWWWCDDGSGPGGGIHYSTGPRLVIGDVPDTATAPVTSPDSQGSRGSPAGLLLALGAAVAVGILLRSPVARRAAGSSGGQDIGGR